MKLHNTIAKKVDDFKALEDKSVRMYSCGPTVYDHIHIGNLSSFIVVDTLRRVLQVNGYSVKHVMNITDVDDKTIARSRQEFPDASPEEALKQLTQKYEALFLDDMRAVGNDVEALTLVRATENIEAMQALITQLYNDGFAYVADDGVYFSIEKYKASGKKYGRLVEVNAQNTSAARIDNDEYDKDSVHDFALWKTRKGEEPAWDFELDGHNLLGRPGWHIECSAMSTKILGQPFDIHTGGVDLMFPHHENEIAQSTAGKSEDFAEFFVHNEHLLVDGRKMSKSLNNFYTLDDIKEKGIDPLAFRLLVLQSHYRSQSNFTWENLQAAQNSLANFYTWADLQFQSFTSEKLRTNYNEALPTFSGEMLGDLGTPAALAVFNGMVNRTDELGIDSAAIAQAIPAIEEMFGLGLAARKDITSEQEQLITNRRKARETEDWQKADELRNQLTKQGVGVSDTPQGQVWFRL